jgi:hypothetical protein
VKGRHGYWIVAALALASSLVRLYLAHRYYGFQTGDDLEVAEEAFRRAAGLVHDPWDVRNLLIPDLLVAPFVAFVHAAGVRDPLLLATMARYPFVLLSALNVVLVFLVGRRWYDDATGVVASGLYAFHWIPLVYGSSLYPRVFAVTCVLGAALFLHRSHVAVAGALAALAVTARYSEAIFLAPLLVFARRRVLLLVSFALGVCVFVGLYDFLTYGRWFGSLVEFAELTFVRRDAASAVVRQPQWWYVTNVLHWIPTTLLPFLVVAWQRGERRRLMAFVALPVLALSAIFHKELRYLQVVVPFVLLLAARGFTLWHEQPNRRRLATALLILALPLGLARIGVAERRSTNAVTAALWMRERAFPSVALSQAWSYGGRLFLGNDVTITDIGIPPALERLPPTSAVAVYSPDVTDALRTACHAAGLTETRTFTGHGGREVTVFYHPTRLMRRRLAGADLAGHSLSSPTLRHQTTQDVSSPCARRPHA